MASVTKSTSEQGQISIFFSASIVVLVSIIAFVINIGLFVKAKINLQNATDAAAFSGAAVQARQLTKIAYLNWEMRNIYKEWMYKYYVIGNLNIDDVQNPTGTGPMSFRLQDDVNAITSSRAVDPFNFPAVCIHLAGSQTNICRKYAIPGLPEFGSSNLPGAEEASRAFLDALIGTKIDDCIERTRLNMLVALTWSYNVLSDPGLDNTLIGQGPAILADRQGAWPRAVELAIRMRNLEFVMNRDAETGGVCNNPGNVKEASCGKSIASVIGENKMGNERIVKAFYSGYRNLGNDVDSEMKESFTLTELSPKPVTKSQLGGETSASYLLYPKTRQEPKTYVDLKLMMVNLATFYAAMIPRGDGGQSGACDVSKVAIPVPGYPMGFTKNPDVVTYYAVRGEAEFIGMFNPFDNEVIKMTAYAAAKPFGGRVGPMLYVQRKGDSFFRGRTDTEERRSVPYLATLEFEGAPFKNAIPPEGPNLRLGDFGPGTPLPINFPEGTPPGYFWIKNDDDPIGGLTADASGIKYGLPNMVYDYQVPFQDTGYTLSGGQIHRIKADVNKANDQAVGLFSKFQFQKFKGTLPDVVSKVTLENEIYRVRAPTQYETANYLVPSPSSLNLSSELDSFGFISADPQPRGATKVHTNFVYAPLFKNNDQGDVLFNNSSEVVSSIFDFMRAQETGIDKYRYALNQGAVAIFKMKDKIAGAAANSGPKYRAAAMGVSDINLEAVDIRNEKPGSCKSLAGQFLYFYYGDDDFGMNPVTDPAGCPVPLGTQLKRYFAGTSVGDNYDPTFYKFEYSLNEGVMDPQKLFTAYMPGPFTGVGDNGVFANPISGASETTRRNFYSTKFVSLDSLRGGPGYTESATNFVIYSEGGITTLPNLDRSQNAFENRLTTDGTNLSDGDLNSINH